MNGMGFLAIELHKVDALINLLVEKGVITKEEFAKAIVAMLADLGLLVFIVKDNELVAYKSSIDKKLKYEEFIS